jgi:heme-degrading monooxygenase HmoA
MSVVKINAIEIPDGAGPELEGRFAARAGAVDNQPGFEEFMLLRPVSGENRYFVVTRWESEEAFQNWKNGQAFGAAHGQPAGGPPAGGQPAHGQPAGAHGGEAPKPPVGMGASLLEFEVVSISHPA